MQNFRPRNYFVQDIVCVSVCVGGGGGGVTPAIYLTSIKKTMHNRFNRGVVSYRCTPPCLSKKFYWDLLWEIATITKSSPLKK